MGDDDLFNLKIVVVDEGENVFDIVAGSDDFRGKGEKNSEKNPLKS